MGKTRTLAVLAAPILAATLTVSAAQAGKADNSLVFGQSIPITDLGPAYGAFLRYPAGYEAAYVIYDRLVTFDADLNIKPQLAESWTVSADQKTTTFKLRPNVKFHDGTPLDAKAVRFNIERMMDPKRNTTNRPIWEPVAGAQVVDDLTIAIVTKEPYALLLNTLAHGSGAIVSPASIEKYGDEAAGQHPVGAGPFMLESFSQGQEVVVKAFPGYWAGRPKLDKIVFKYIPEAPTRISSLKTGSVDVIDSVPYHLLPGLKNDSNVRIVSKPGLRPMGFAILTTRAPFDDVKVRQALNHAIPVQTISDKLFFGYAKASDSPLAFNTTGHKALGGYDYNPDKARKLLQEAGFKDTNGDGIVEKDGKPFTLRLVTSDGQFPGDLQVAEIAASAYKAVGINVVINKIEKAAYWDTLRVKEAEVTWDLAVFGFNPSNGAGSYHLDSMFYSNPDAKDRPSAWNIVRYSNPQVDALIDKAKVTVDPAAHNDLLGQAQEIIWKDAPYVWMHVPEIVSATGKDVQGVEVWPIIFTIVRGAHY